MREQRGFVLGVVLVIIVLLAIGGVAAIALSSSEVEMVGALRQNRQLEACAESGLEAAAANLPFPANAPATWAVDPNRSTATQQYQAIAEHVDNTSVVGSTLSAPRAALAPDAAAALLQAAMVGESIANSPASGLDAPNAPSPSMQQRITVFRLVSTCQQRAVGGRTEAEGVYVYNPK